MIILKTYNPIIDAFLSELIGELNKSRVKIILSMKSFVGESYEMRSNGYFSDAPKEFAVAFNCSQKKWLTTLVHESCHFDQWKENSKIWKQYDVMLEKTGKKDPFTDWINKEPFTTKDQEKICSFFKTAKKLEYDCECRAVKKIKKYNLPLDLKSYIKKANAYVLFYDYIIKYRKWYKIGSEPYNNADILKYMPDSLELNYGLNKKVLKHYHNCV